ncbi:MAG: gamma-glutamyl-phosphate reductase, partial [Phycisphaerae bacterium]|nr:gamma-glutamyl-phosphate reductase [Phycisphaerae bacterium]
MENADTYIKGIASAARAAAAELTVSTTAKRDAALIAAAKAIRNGTDRIRAQNTKDLAEAKKAGLSDAMIDRLTLTDARIEAMAAGLEAIAAQTDPVGQTISASNRPTGLRIEKRRVPLGVVAIIFESRPNVTADAAGLCIKSGNAVILRGG